MKKHKRLELLGLEIEERLEKGGTSIANEVCRHITGPDPKIASFLLTKVVEWRYGKPMQTVQLEEKEPLPIGIDFGAETGSATEAGPN